MGTAVLKRLERAIKHSPSSVGEVKNEGVGTSSSLQYLHGLEWESLSLPLPAFFFLEFSWTRLMSNCDVISDKTNCERCGMRHVF